MSQQPHLYLASLSPRRHQLLAQLGVDFATISLEVDEACLEHESVEKYVIRLALEKARAGYLSTSRRVDVPVLAADTTVFVAGDVFGKPRDQQHALAMLEQLSGRVHQVYTAVALVSDDSQCSDNEQSSLCVTNVSFREITQDERLAYWQSGEPQGKAGGYAVQGLGAMFVERIEGSYSGVMGLPLFETANLLKRFGVALNSR